MSSSPVPMWRRRIVRSEALPTRRVTDSGRLRWRSRFCFEVLGAAEAYVGAAFYGAYPHSVGAREVLFDVSPGASAYYAIHALIGAFRICVRSFLVVVDVVPVGA